MQSGTTDDKDVTQMNSASCLIHIVTILYKSESSIGEFLGCLQRQTFSDWRLHVIDNASPDHSRAIVDQLQDARITVHANATNLGFAKAANQGLRAAYAEGAEAVILVNNDIYFADDFLRHFADVARGSGELVVAPRIMERNDPSVAWYAGGDLDYTWVFKNTHHRHEVGMRGVAMRVNFAPACCIWIDRAVLERVGLLDESFFVYWEDTDYCLRLQKLDVPILYVPEPSLLHDCAASSEGEHTPSHIRLYYCSYMQILRKQFGWGYAARSMLRLLMLEHGRKNRNIVKIRAMAAAMARGMVAPLQPEVWLDRG
jgi:GT2 family glycosyltransferase